MKYIGIGDFFLIAEAVLTKRHGPHGHSARALNRATDPQRVMSEFREAEHRFGQVRVHEAGFDG